MTTAGDAAAQAATRKIPLCVDLDGTLVHCDTLVNSVLLLVKQNPLNIFAMLYWLLGGRAGFKEMVAMRVRPAADALPYHNEFLDWLRGQRESGRDVVLVTAANYRIAQEIAQHLQLFSDVIASSATENLKAAKKRDALVTRYGAGGYDYAGNSRADLAVWKSCRRAILVNVPAQIESLARAGNEVECSFSGPARRPRAFIS